MYYYVIIILFFFSFFLSAHAINDEPIFITKSSLDKIIFDGKWTFSTEWKLTALKTLNFENGTTIYFRIAHDSEFMRTWSCRPPTSAWRRTRWPASMPRKRVRRSISRRGSRPWRWSPWPTPAPPRIWTSRYRSASEHRESGAAWTRLPSRATGSAHSRG